MRKVVITAEDLYFLSRVMKAKYMDYDYFKMVSELTSRYALKESNAIEHLCDNGLVYEDFTGDIEVEDLGKELFEPIFFGEFESELLIEDKTSLERYKYHVLDGRYIEVAIHDKNLIVSEVNKEDILEHLPYVEDPSLKETFNLDYFKDKDVDGIMVLKRQKMKEPSKCIQLVNDNGVYHQSKGLKIHALTKDELKQLMKKVLWEE